MTRVVVDASVASKWVLDEEFSDRAADLLEGHDLIVPSHWKLEAAESLSIRVMVGALSSEVAAERLRALNYAPVTEVSYQEVFTDAVNIASDLDILLREALYVALAVSYGCALITADRDLVERLASRASEYQIDAYWIGRDDTAGEAANPEAEASPST